MAPPAASHQHRETCRSARQQAQLLVRCCPVLCCTVPATYPPSPVALPPAYQRFRRQCLLQSPPPCLQESLRQWWGRCASRTRRACAVP